MKLTYTDKLHNNTKDSVLENERNDKLPNCKVNRKGQLIKNVLLQLKGDSILERILFTAVSWCVRGQKLIKHFSVTGDDQNVLSAVYHYDWSSSLMQLIN